MGYHPSPAQRSFPHQKVKVKCTQKRGNLLARSSTANINLAELEEEQDIDHMTQLMPTSPSPAASPHCFSHLLSRNLSTYEQKEENVVQSKWTALSMFDGDVRAYNTWLTLSNSESVSMRKLCPKMSAFMSESVGCSRAVTVNDLMPFLQCFCKMDSSCLTLSRSEFVACWRWMRQASEILKEVRGLWDDHLI